MWKSISLTAYIKETIILSMNGLGTLIKNSLATEVFIEDPLYISCSFQDSPFVLYRHICLILLLFIVLPQMLHFFTNWRSVAILSQASLSICDQHYYQLLYCESSERLHNLLTPLAWGGDTYNRYWHPVCHRTVCGLIKAIFEWV